MVWEFLSAKKKNESNFFEKWIFATLEQMIRPIGPQNYRKSRKKPDFRHGSFDKNKKKILGNFFDKISKHILKFFWPAFLENFGLLLVLSIFEILVDLSILKILIGAKKNRF